MQEAASNRCLLARFDNSIQLSHFLISIETFFLTRGEGGLIELIYEYDTVLYFFFSKRVKSLFFFFILKIGFDGIIQFIPTRITKLRIQRLLYRLRGIKKKKKHFPFISSFSNLNKDANNILSRRNLLLKSVPLNDGFSPRAFIFVFNV